MADKRPTREALEKEYIELSARVSKLREIIEGVSGIVLGTRWIAEDEVIDRIEKRIKSDAVGREVEQAKMHEVIARLRENLSMAADENARLWYMVRVAMKDETLGLPNSRPDGDGPDMSPFSNPSFKNYKNF